MSQPDWQIRPFRTADQSAVRQLILEGLGEHFGVVDETLNPDIDDIATHYIARGRVFLVAVDGDAVVGSGALIIEDTRVGRLVRVSAARGYRRRGLGRALVERLIAAARGHGLRRLWMETNDDWAPAIGLYRSCGFHEYDRRDGNIYMALDLTCNPPPPSA